MSQWQPITLEKCHSGSLWDRKPELWCHAPAGEGYLRSKNTHRICCVKKLRMAQAQSFRAHTPGGFTWVSVWTHYGSLFCYMEWARHVARRDNSFSRRVTCQIFQLMLGPLLGSSWAHTWAHTWAQAGLTLGSSWAHWNSNTTKKLDPHVWSLVM